MKLQAVAPEGLVSERIESKCFPSLLHEFACIASNDSIKITSSWPGVPALADDRERQSTDGRNCRNHEYSRHAFHIFHDLPPQNTEWQARVPLQFPVEKNFLAFV